MRAVVYRGVGHVEVGDVADPEIVEPADAIVRVGLTAICGSDLHLFHGKAPLEPGDTIGHEAIGVVEQVGPAVRRFAPGDRVVVSFTVADGTCWFCRHGLTAVVSSAMRRAVDTAAPIAAACGVPHHLEPDLHERRVGAMAGQPFALHDGPWADTLANWTAGNTAFTTEGAESFDDLAGLADRRPILAAALTVFLISLTGVPVSAGFVGKFYLFNAAVSAGYAGLAVVGVLMSVVSAYYYLRVVVVMYMREPIAAADTWAPVTGAASLALALSTAVVLGLGVHPGPVLGWARLAAQSLR